MADAADDVPGFTVPVHRALTEPILLGGAPRAIAIMNGTLAGAVGLGPDGDYRVTPAISTPVFEGDGGDPATLNPSHEGENL